MKNYTYIPHIDGLRAIASLSVVFFHANLNINSIEIFDGGYIGVDVFFVISGYLISLQILNNYQTKNFGFFIKEFYFRRFKRILPALFFTILIFIPIAWYVFLPTELLFFSKSILYTLLSVPNFFFYEVGTEYNNSINFGAPFLNFWSLGVEIHFYLIFPILVFFILKLFNKSVLICILFILTLVSLISCNYFYDPVNYYTFYLTQFRAWELFIGSIVAIIYNSKIKKIENFTSEFISAVSLLILISSIFFFSNNTKHPSYLTLIPTLATSIIILFGRNSAFINFILANRIAIYFGLISYPLYLLHFPLFTFVRFEDLINNEFYLKILLGISLILLSHFVYNYIEKPFRKKISVKFFLFFLFSSYIIFSYFVAITILKNGKINQINSIIQESKIDKIFDDQLCKFSTGEKYLFSPKKTDSNFMSNINLITRFENCYKKNGKFILVVGDSHAMDLFNSFAYNTKAINLFGISRPCRPSDKKKEICHYEHILNFLKKNSEKIEGVIFNIKGSYLLTDTSKGQDKGNPDYRKLPINLEEIEEIKILLKKIRKINKNVFFIGPHIEPNLKIDRNIFKKINKNEYNLRAKKELKDVDNYLKNIFINNEVLYISKIDLINFDFKKDFYLEDAFSFSDTDHWSKKGEKIFGKRILKNKVLENLLK